MKSFNAYCNAVRKCLENKQILSTKLEDWLLRQRMLYKHNPTLHTPEEINRLDQLNDLLGYDWKKSYKENSSGRPGNIKMTFEQHCQQIYDTLSEGDPITKPQYYWLFRQRKNLRGLTTTKLSTAQIEQIDKATARSDYDWKIGKVDFIFNQRCQAVLALKGHPEQLSPEQKNWLNSLKNRYIHQNPSKSSPYRIERIEKLIAELKLDWKIAEAVSPTV